MELSLYVRLCRVDIASKLCLVPCQLPASCRMLCQRQKHLHVTPHQQCSHCWVTCPDVVCNLLLKHTTQERRRWRVD